MLAHTFDHVPDGSFGAVMLTQGLEQLQLIAADSALMFAHSSAELGTCVVWR